MCLYHTWYCVHACVQRTGVYTYVDLRLLRSAEILRGQYPVGLQSARVQARSLQPSRGLRGETRRSTCLQQKGHAAGCGHGGRSPALALVHMFAGDLRAGAQQDNARRRHGCFRAWRLRIIDECRCQLPVQTICACTQPAHTARSPASHRIATTLLAAPASSISWAKTGSSSPTASHSLSRSHAQCRRSIARRRSVCTLSAPHRTLP